MHRLLHDVNFISVINIILDGIIIIDNKGLILAFNHGATKIFGYELDEVVGKNVNVLMPEPYHSEHDGYIRNYIETRDPKIIGTGREVRGRRKNGEIFPMDLGVTMMQDQQPIMFMGTVRDITEQKRYERELLVFNQKLKRSNQELEDFAYIASHDLKEPLRGLSNNALFLKEDNAGQLDEKAIQRIDRMIFLTGRMEQLINDLLHFSRIGKQHEAVQTCAVQDIVNEVVDVFESVKESEKINVHIQENIPSVVCDKVRIREVFHNLLSNAIKYNDKENKIIEIGYQGNDTFFVKDNGMGIAKHFYEDVFRIFKRLNHEDDDVRGTGVGLTFVKKIIEYHGGRIWIESEEGAGTSFFFTLPTAPFTEGEKNDES